MTEQLTLRLKTLTPLWTGGVDGAMDRIHETGILGSLRWWYEAIVRGLGGSARDPTSERTAERCQFDTKAYEKTKNVEDGLAGVCPVCRLFGCTGWQRRFRLVIDSHDLTETWSGGQINVKPPDRNRGWYLNAGQMGTFHLKITADEGTQAQVLALIQFAARCGSLGARPQLGYGLFEIVDVKNQPQSTYEWDVTGNGSSNHALPDLRTFTFFTLNFEPQRDDWWRDVSGIGSLARDSRYRNAVDGLLRHHIMPTTPALRNVLRYGQQWSSGALPHQFFGTLRGDERSRSKIALSWAYQLPDSPSWQIRGWAYPPQVGQAQQQEVQQRLQTVLGKPEMWLRALNVRYRAAEVLYAPAATFFQPVTSAQVQQFVREPSLAEVQR